MADLRWSYSSLSMFQQCPKKYYHNYVAKDVPRDQDTDALREGREAHLAFEERLRDGTPLPDKYAHHEPLMQKLAAMKGTLHCEYEMGLRGDMTPCEFNAPDVWARGIADVLIVDGENAKVLDYKTGKSSKYADTKQLKLMALMVFKHFPEVKKVRSGLIFVVAKDFVPKDYVLEEAGGYWMDFLPDIKRIENAMENGVWNPAPNFTCRNYCNVKQCMHNGG